MDAKSAFLDFAGRTGMFRCRVTGNPCGTDTTLVGVECPMGKDHPCQHRVAFQAGWEAAYAVNFPPDIRVEFDASALEREMQQSPKGRGE